VRELSPTQEHSDIVPTHALIGEKPTYGKQAYDGRTTNCFLSAEYLAALARKEKCGCTAPRRAKDEESGADFSRAQGKGFLTPAAPRNNQRIPCRSSLPEFLNN
jgi:hypothetical protein